ncbi:hypothetical protein RD792_001553 [Penstemon davidsonii]|uniref:Uncharacterized protein n=1 Tax=Penstemon davidsonii TaxID=160366 RepID=A0ABR0DPY2_9LAMI|nr:hypothetical protein RD792_001553 [Penstemon davidsonii]
MSNSKAVYEGWMVRYGRRKIGRSFIHMRYFVLESRLLAYYKKKPQDNVVPIKTILIDGNCRVEDRGLKTHHGHMVYVLSVYNKKEKYQRLTMAAFNIQEALIWKEKIESVIDQHQESQATNGNKYHSFEYKSGMDSGRNASSSDHESQFSAAEDEDDSHPSPPESVLDWTKELDSDLANQNSSNQAFSRKFWRLLQCQNGLRIFEELLEVDFLPKSCSRAMKAVGVVEATCEEVVEQKFVWPRDLCYVRYWRRNDDGSYVVLFRSREHENCGPQPGFVRANIESGGYNISPLKPRNGRPRTQVQHLMQIDLKGWGVGYMSSFQQHCLLQMLNSVAESCCHPSDAAISSSSISTMSSMFNAVTGLREYFSLTDERTAAPRIPVMVNMTSVSGSSKKSQKVQSSFVHHRTPSLDQIHAANRNAVLMDDYSDEDEDIDGLQSSVEIEDKRTAYEEESQDQIDLSIFSGNLRRDDHDKARDCWTLSEGKHLMDLVAVDWFKDTKRMDHVARRRGCAAQVASDRGHFSIVFNLQVPGSTHYSMVFYFVAKELVPGSLLQRFIDGDDEFRNSRLKLIPSVPKGSWIVRQSVGSTPCLLGKAVDCNYIRGPKYLEVDIDIGSSTVANGVLGLVIGVITTLVVDMAFLVQANTTDELPERLIGAVRVSHIELSSAIVPILEADNSDSVKS